MYFCGVIDGGIRVVVRRHGDLIFVKKWWLKKGFARDRRKEPELHYNAVSKGVRSSEPHPEACWLEPTFRFARTNPPRDQSTRANPSSLERTLLESCRLEPTSGPLEPTIL